jgi:hypothetical protein
VPPPYAERGGGTDIVHAMRALLLRPLGAEAPKALLRGPFPTCHEKRAGGENPE